MPLLSPHWALQPPDNSREAPKTKQLEAILRGLSAWEETPGAAGTPSPAPGAAACSALLLPGLQKGTVLGWPDLQAVFLLGSQAPSQQRPLVAI